MKTNRLLFGPKASIAATVARAIERAERDPRFSASEMTAHKCAWAERGANWQAMIDAEYRDHDVIATCGQYPGDARAIATLEGHGMHPVSRRFAGFAVLPILALLAIVPFFIDLAQRVTL